ncbi:MAG TPA: hypothetical protein VHX61_01290 [Rhizomicrobium sp.]|jgi:hypothetical protein|nr:hypothetical protein [Rhizomicrobium sp.]
MELQDAYYWSQIILTIIAAAAAIAAYIQLQTFKRFELLKILQDEATHEARRKVFREIKLLKGTEWWSDDKLEDIAVKVCATYDLAGIIAKGRNRAFFVKHWGYSVCATYEILIEYLDWRRKNSRSTFLGYSKLYKAAQKHHPEALRHAAPN